ncbi:unnamed protein product [Wuchereria bancrofti]|uniref:Uncharacterized protein n=1 Tax=Wuchereria bancrofti TaxID=6293 RepID=A0A3P7FWC0_WUCBA|nr:unnamed protein product [Wuchereria bancrofti]
MKSKNHNKNNISSSSDSSIYFNLMHNFTQIFHSVLLVLFHIFNFSSF